ncbi:MAG TPA: hypothetical protein VD866_12080 [Urbifossiella sp.]|nr:hypothetical protein [Urbifossiella sp.]
MTAPDPFRRSPDQPDTLLAAAELLILAHGARADSAADWDRLKRAVLAEKPGSRAVWFNPVAGGAGETAAGGDWRTDEALNGRR